MNYFPMRDQISDAAWAWWIELPAELWICEAAVLRAPKIQSTHHEHAKEIAVYYTTQRLKE